MNSRIRFRHWFASRRISYIVRRLLILLTRYGITPSLAEKRVFDGVQALAKYSCRPTFAVPGRIVARNPDFCRELQRQGAELSIHGHDHVDFRSLEPGEARAQFMAAAAAFRRSGIEFEGFRCPYLSYTDELQPTLPPGEFAYSSNKAIWWDVVPPGADQYATAVFRSLRRFYCPTPSSEALAIPKINGQLLEIPASLPDDIQIADGLRLGRAGMKELWTDILYRTHSRGEIFVLISHPETFDQTTPALEDLLRTAQRLKPSVWVAQLRDVSRWWWEKSEFTTELSITGPRTRIQFTCSHRATILVRGVITRNRTRRWDGQYEIVEGREVEVAPGPLPLVGVADDVPSAALTFLADQGYIVEAGENAQRCGIFLRQPDFAVSEVALVEKIESSGAPLLRFWRWPDANRSVLCITGDLDAVSLFDYVSRLLPSSPLLPRFTMRAPADSRDS